MLNLRVGEHRRYSNLNSGYQLSGISSLYIIVIDYNSD